MVAYTKAQILRLIKIDFVRFCVVGGTGFLINLGLLILFRQVVGMPIFLAQLLAAEVALFSNFMLHHRWTYKAHKVEKTMLTLLLQFHATTWPAIIGSALMVTAGETIFNLTNLEALVVSSAVALMWNFSWSKYVVWRDTSREEIKHMAD